MGDNSRLKIRHLSTRHVPEEPSRIPFGRAVLRRSSEDLTLLAIGNIVPLALRVTAAALAVGSCLDSYPRMLAPLDRETIFNSVIKTGRLVVAAYGWKLFRASALHKVRLIASVEP